LGGNSSGACLAIQATLYAKEQGITILYQPLVSLMGDLSNTIGKNEKYKKFEEFEKKKDEVYNLFTLNFHTYHYLTTDRSPNDPIISPVFADTKNFYGISKNRFILWRIRCIFEVMMKLTSINLKKQKLKYKVLFLTKQCILFFILKLQAISASKKSR